MKKLLLLAALLTQALSAQPKIPCYGNVSITDVSAGRVPVKLGMVEALNGEGIRGGGTGDGYTRYQGRAQELANAVEEKGWRWLFSINGQWGSTERYLTETQVFAGGQAWAPFLDANRTTIPFGVGLMNEHNKQVETAYTQGADYMAVLQQGVNIIVGFALGVHSRCPTCDVYAGGFGGQKISSSRINRLDSLYLSALAPYVRNGTLANTFDVHVYRNATENITNLGSNIRAWLNRTGWPQGTRIIITEANLRNLSTLSVPQQIDATRNFLRNLYSFADAVCGYTPFQGDDALNHIDPALPLGQGFAEIAAEIAAVDTVIVPPPACDTSCVITHHEEVTRVDTTYITHPEVWGTETYCAKYNLGINFLGCRRWSTRAVKLSDMWIEQVITTIVITPAYDETICTITCH